MEPPGELRLVTLLPLYIGLRHKMSTFIRLLHAAAAKPQRLA